MQEQARLKVGGQALADGVFMRTERAWAVARADGTVEVGTTPPKRCPGVPVVRVLLGLFTSLRLGIEKGLMGGRRRDREGPVARRGRRGNRQFLLGLLACEAVVVVFGWIVDAVPATGVARSVLHAVPWIAVLVVLRIASPQVVWRYHGAEHKAVSAYEQGVDLDDVGAVMGCPRVHNRCGTNLVFLVAVAGVAFQHRSSAAQLVLFLLSLATAAELTALAAKRPAALWSRVLLGGGRFLQRYVTTVEPSEAEQRIGCRALQAALAEHARLESAAFEVSAPVPL